MPDHFGFETLDEYAARLERDHAQDILRGQNMATHALQDMRFQDILRDAGDLAEQARQEIDIARQNLPQIVPLGRNPVQYYYQGDRYPVHFDRITMPTFTTTTIPMLNPVDILNRDDALVTHMTANTIEDINQEMQARETQLYNELHASEPKGWLVRKYIAIGRTIGKTMGCIHSMLFQFYRTLGGFPKAVEPVVVPPIPVTPEPLTVNPILRKLVRVTSRERNEVTIYKVGELFSAPILLKVLSEGHIVQDALCNCALVDAELIRNGELVRVWSIEENKYV